MTKDLNKLIGFVEEHLDSSPEEPPQPSPVELARQRCRDFDFETFNAWLLRQSATVQDLASLCPPNQIYIDPEGELVFVLKYLGQSFVLVGYVDTEKNTPELRPPYACPYHVLDVDLDVPASAT